MTQTVEMVPRRESQRRGRAPKRRAGSPQPGSSKDAGLVEALIQPAALCAYENGNAAVVEESLRRLDDDRLLERHVAFAVVGAWCHAYSGRPEQAERWFRTAERAADEYDSDLPDGSRSVSSWLAVLRAGLCREGPEQMRADSEQALEELAATSIWRPDAHYLLGCASHLLGDDGVAEREWNVVLEMARTSGANPLAAQVLGQLALLALDRGDVSTAAELLATAQELPGPPFGSHVAHGVPVAALARLSLAESDREAARRWILRAKTLRPLHTWALPCRAVQVRLELANVAAALLDDLGCRTLLVEIKEIESHRPALGTLVDGITRLTAQVELFRTSSWNWAASLTPAELGLLPVLATYLTLEEIAQRFLLSRHTVKAQAAAIYRKLHATSRSQAVERAVELGLLGRTVLLPQPGAERDRLRPHATH